MSDAQELVKNFRDQNCGDEIEAAIVVARILEPGVDRLAVLAQCDSLASEVVNELQAAPSIDVPSLCECLRDLGFSGAGEAYYQLSNSRLDEVLSSRRGIPITLALVYLVGARAVGLSASGVNFPGHFLVRVEDMFVDPYRHHTQTESECLARVERGGDPRAAANLLRRATPEDFLIRMLNNVRSILNDAGELSQALDVVQCQRILRPRELGLGVEEARLWERLAVPARASLTLTELLPWVEHEQTREQMTHWIAQLDTQGNPTVH